MEVQTLFPPLLMALLFHTSFLVVEGDAAHVQGHQHATKWMDPMRYLWPLARVAGDLGATHLAPTSRRSPATGWARSPPAASNALLTPLPGH